MKPRPIKIIDGIGYVPLTQGKTAIVDAEDVPLIKDQNWYVQKGRDTFYARTRDKKTRDTILMHMVFVPNVIEVDHKDGDGLNNRRGNLRKSTPSQNRCNWTHLRRNNPSGYCGVALSPRGDGWYARAAINGKSKYLGRFGTPEDAARAYDEAAREHYGEFARLNFPREGERGAR